MLNLNFNILNSKLNEQPRGVFEGLVSASFVLYGGGGGGASNGIGGGGGGAGMVVSGALHIARDGVYTVIVGGGASASAFVPNTTANKGGDSWIYGWTQDTFTTMSVKAGGGFCGGFVSGTLDNDQYRNGGSSGDGYIYFRAGVSSSFPALAGTAYDPNNLAAGGGGGSAGRGNENRGGVTGNGGNGKMISGSNFQTFGYYEALPIGPGADDPEWIAAASSSLGAAGGGGGGQISADAGGIGGQFGGGNGNAVPPYDTTYATAYYPGAGGGGKNYQGGGEAGNGADGRAYLIYCGVPKLQITNGSTIYNAQFNRTVHIFEKGTGSFVFTNQYWQTPGCGYPYP